ncbi:MAG TPA: hypothetical protein VJN18_04550 [Polyangiaceae bacterium]|nr:hypothetical protein [Polyangiaceae bacterium]
MDTVSPSRDRDDGTWRRVFWLVLLWNALWLGRGVIDPGFRNLDVTGIVYNARLLLVGKLPYLHSAEVKPPGAFVLLAPALWLGGLRGVWLLGVVWGTLTSLASGALAKACYGDKWGRRVALLHAVASVVASDADINYSFWMALPFTLSAAMAMRAAHARGEWNYAVCWSFAGALALLAVSIKPSAWPLVLLFAGLWLRELSRGDLVRALSLPAWGLCGALFATLLVAFPFWLHGRLDVLSGGLANVRSFGEEYVGLVVQGAGGYLNAATTGMQCLPEKIPAMLGVALLGCLPGRVGVPASRLGFAPWLFLLASLAGVTMTLRFFTHDNAQLWPALAVLALRPSGLLARLFDAVQARGRVKLLRCLPVVLGLLVALPGLWERFWLHWYFVSNDHKVAGICRRFEPLLSPSDSVLAWGWQAWSVYEHCHRLAPGPVYKTIGTVTTLNTNTCNRGYGRLQLRQGDVTERFMADLERNPPGLILWSTYHQDMGGDPLDDWAELSVFLEQRYAMVASEKQLIAYLRKDRLARGR